MASINQMFALAITKGLEAAENISDLDKKASAYASIAHAIAETGLVSVDYDDSDSSPNSATKEDIKETPKPKKAKKEAPSEEFVEEVAETVAEDEVVEEWTEAMIEKFSLELDKVSQYQEEYGDDTIDECVQSFSEGNFNSIADISPLNIGGFISYMDMLSSDAQEA